MPNAVYDQILDKVVTDIRALNLDKVGQNVHKRKWNWDDASFYGITVSPAQEKVGGSSFTAQGTNSQDLIGYPAVCIFSQGTHRGTAADLDRITLWRQTVRRHFNNQRLGGLTDCIEVCAKVTMDEIEIPSEYKSRNLDVGQLTVWCWVLESRS